MVTFKQHKAKWQDCQRCPLCETRKTVVLARGTVPAEILFIGEAPGASEDVIGKPFIGPAGHLLDHMIERAWGKQYTYAMTNLVSCIPLGEDGNKTAEPSDEAIEACTPRLVEFFKLCKPKLVICVGKLSEEWAYSLVDGESYLNVKWASITHPAAILRADISQKALLVQKNVIALADAVEEI